MAHRLQTLPRHTDLQVILHALDEDGGVIVRDFIDEDLLRRLNTEFQADIDKTAPGSDIVGEEMSIFWGNQTKRFTRLTARAPSFAELLDHDLMHEWAAHSLQGDYWLNTGQAMIVGPGEQGQRLHRDIAIWPLFEEIGRDAPENDFGDGREQLGIASALIVCGVFCASLFDGIAKRPGLRARVTGQSQVAGLHADTASGGHARRRHACRQCVTVSGQDGAWGRPKRDRRPVATRAAHELLPGMAHAGGSIHRRRAVGNCEAVFEPGGLHA